MYKTIYPLNDATIYERHPYRNTGVDQILELSKITAGSPIEDQLAGGEEWDFTYNSRILIKFDLTSISTEISTGRINGSVQYFLTLKATDAMEIPIEYTVNSYPISGSWTNGTGYYNNNPEIKNGVSWAYRNGESYGMYWESGSMGGNVTGSFVTQRGGGIWFTGSGYEASQSFNYSSADVRMNVTDIVNKWLSGSISNNGMIIKFPTSSETDSSIMGSIKFFSKDTHTIYIPRLEVYWNSYDETGTGSYSEVSNDNFVVYIKNLKDAYLESEKTKLRIGVRDRYPVKTYSTQSNYIQQLRLPTESYYAIYDYVTDEPVIDFHEYTKISCDSNGNYIAMDMSSFLPERYYKILIKTTVDEDSTKLIDDGFYFKIHRT